MYTFHFCKSSRAEIRLIVIGIYRAPNTDLDNFSSQFEILLKKLFIDRLKLLIVGKVNIDILTDRTDCKRFRDVLQTFNLEWLINSSTRVVATSATATHYE